MARKKWSRRKKWVVSGLVLLALGIYGSQDSVNNLSTSSGGGVGGSPPSTTVTDPATGSTIALPLTGGGSPSSSSSSTSSSNSAAEVSAAGSFLSGIAGVGALVASRRRKDRPTEATT